MVCQRTDRTSAPCFNDLLPDCAKNAERLFANETLLPTVGEAHREGTPIGALFRVEPCNSPYFPLARVAGPQPMVGKVLLVKHAGIVPHCALAFKRLRLEAGTPADACA